MVTDDRRIVNIVEMIMVRKNIDKSIVVIFMIKKI